MLDPVTLKDVEDKKLAQKGMKYSTMRTLIMEEFRKVASRKEFLKPRGANDMDVSGLAPNLPQYTEQEEI